MQTTVIVPIDKNQLVILYRQGFNTIDSSRIIFANLENNLPVIPENVLTSKLPVFEEDFELLLIEFDLIFSTQIIQNKAIVTPNLELPLEISFHDIKRIYPLSERGAKLLNLGERIKLEKPIFEAEVKKAEQNFKLKAYFQGGFALLNILELESSLIKQHAQSLNEIFTEAFHFRSKPKVKAGDMPKSNNLLKVLCYERYEGIIPENDLGFLCDIGFLFAQTQSNNVKFATDSQLVVALIKGNETEFKNITFAQTLDLLESKYPKIKEGMKSINFQFATYLFYFKIKAILNEGKQISETSLPKIVQEFKDTEYKNNLITAAWLAGSFFGYSRFFTELHQDKSKHEKHESKIPKKIEKEQTVTSSKMNSQESLKDETLTKSVQSEENPNNIVVPIKEQVKNSKIKKNSIQITNFEQPTELNLKNKEGGLFADIKDIQAPKE